MRRHRERARVAAAASGPTLLVVGAIHGNEPAGLEAAERVTRALAADGALAAGEIAVLAGNLAALERGARCVDHDLNRVWTDASIAAAQTAPRSAEDRELAELHAAMRAVGARARGRVAVLDLHTSSAEGIPFAMEGKGGGGGALVDSLGIPVVAGLLDTLEGVLADYWAARGWATLAVEGGQHEAQTARDDLESVLWHALGALGMTADGAAARAAGERIGRRCAGVPRAVSVVRRHAITPDDGFVMEPGFRSVEAVRRGTVLARDKRGAIVAESDGAVVLPLYQASGSDGFFWAEVPPGRR